VNILGVYGHYKWLYNQSLKNAKGPKAGAKSSPQYDGNFDNFKREESGGDEYIFQDPQVYFIEDATAGDVKQQILSSSENSGRVTVPQDCIDEVLSFDELLQWLKTLRNAEGAEQLH
jgi:hypothetical protein